MVMRSLLQLCFLGVTLFCSVGNIYAQRSNSVQWAYIEKYAALAQKEMKHSGVPASITLAQGLLESGAGRSYLAVQGNNHFGIKCGNDWRGPSLRRTDDAPNECFRAYRSVEESYRDHSDFLAKRQRYAFLFHYDRTDYIAWAHGLKKAGYATNPKYAYSLIGLIEAYRLYEYDTKQAKSKSTSKQHIERDAMLGGRYLVSMANSTYYVIAQGGETCEALSAIVHVSANKLAAYNELPRDHRFTPGEIVYLQKKQKRGHESLGAEPHVVQEGESLHSISQRYAVQLKALYRLNQLLDSYSPKVGDLIWLR